jgi:hypothetical protein
MTEKDPESKICEYDNIRSFLVEKYPQMILPTPLFSQDLDLYITGMNVQERNFAKHLLRRDLVVFREPQLIDYPIVPDFFIYNVFCNRGKLVELTLFNKDFSNGNSSQKSKNRKERQYMCLESCGIPYVILYRDNLESIRRYGIHDLF